MAFELQQLRQVIALAEHGSFVRAAAALHISQPALSRSIQNLERHFGSELFQRSSVGVVPTDVGRLYIERARDLLRLAEDLERDAGDSTDVARRECSRRRRPVSVRVVSRPSRGAIDGTVSRGQRAAPVPRLGRSPA